MDKSEWQTRYDNSRSIRALAREMGVSHSWVARELHQVGIESRIKRAGRKLPAPSEIEKAEWQKRYDEAGSVSELARRAGKTDGTIRHHLKRHGIELRGSGFLSPKSVRHYGTDNGNWKGGTYRHADGYVMEYAPTHPSASSGKGYVLQHRLVMEATLGRFLSSKEMVHHINEVKDDNRSENLELHDRSTHMKHHKSTARRNELGRFS
jgi:DNA-binding transcriptional ArsR family regulator